MKRVVLLSFLVAVATAARADESSEARFFDGEARKAYEAGRFEEALRLFLASNRAAQNPRTLYNAALAADLGGLHAEAFAFFEEYLRSTSDDPARRADAERRRSALEAKLALVEITSDPPGATIFVDRRDLGAHGTTPRIIPLQPGTRTIELELEAHRPESRIVVAERGHKIPLRVALERQTGTLSIEPSGIAGASVAIARDGVEKLYPDDGEPIVLPVGRHRARLIARGRIGDPIDVLIAEGTQLRRALTSRALPVPVGRVLIGTGTVRAVVHLDGRAISETPATLESITAGTHRVELIARGYRSWKSAIRVEANRATYVDVTMVPLE